jgi:GTP-binding protein
MSFRTVAIIAHVDHGKTTLVDALLKQSWAVKTEEWAALIMDSNDQERERGITIYAKNTSVQYGDHTINIIDTPGHADFGSEVERVMRMVDSVILVVDAYEGPMPQTKFVLKKALELGLHPIVVLNKIDKPAARPEWVINELFDLFITLGATDEQADFPVIYAIAKDGVAFLRMDDPRIDISPLFEEIVRIVPPAQDKSDQPLQMQITNLGYDEFVWRLGVGRINAGTIKPGQWVQVVGLDGSRRNAKISKVYKTVWLNRVETSLGTCGDIITIAGVSDIYVGETVWLAGVEALPTINIDEPTLTMEFVVNDSPFMGREGKFVTSRNLNERLTKELETNVWLQIDFADPTRFVVSGRGELHLWVLIETMRREWYELQVTAPQVITRRDENGSLQEPYEQLVITVEDSQVWAIIENISNRKGIMQGMNSDHGQTMIEFIIPTRGLLWFRSDFILITKGEGIMFHSFARYDEWAGDIAKRDVGSMISSTTGKVMKYGVYKLQERWPIFVEPAQDIYEGMIVWEHLKWGDMTVNLTINKQMTNVRNAGNDDAMRLEPIRQMTLEDALGYISNDEYVEITPKTIRLRKKYLTESDRAKAKKR